ncbi:TetR/AcrR family transcriptional regulator [Amycolatopsis nigrescens]|uniref:TetR/AcrR family transcriptional regulator n=1 Tax=Amycolatopsis nigrescens TaxID=381445 RepID=UPI00037F87C9|nr:TetR/AcrR family transcriptional regulator [Amycolatopsis nigrescens]
MPADEQPIPSVWTRPRRRERPALSREQIVAEAVQLLDTEGIEDLSMRRLGGRLDAGATSLYRHVANKDELIELVVDEVYGEIEVPSADDPAGWRASVTVCADSLRAMILRHPWIASLLGEVGLSYLGPNVMRLNDRMLALFEAADFPLDEADKAISTVSAYVIGTAISEAAWLTMVSRSGETEQGWSERLRPAVEEAAQDYPRLRETFTGSAGQDLHRRREENFHYGLERILDGFHVHHGREEQPREP